MATTKEKPALPAAVEGLETLNMAQLEKLAEAWLTWDRRYIDMVPANRTLGYNERRLFSYEGHAQFKTAGYPGQFDNKTFTSRQEYLRHRLRKVVRDQGAKERRAAKVAEEAKKPRVQVKASQNIVIELKDVRPNGHTFTIAKEGSKLTCGQKTNGNYSKKGQTICGTKETFSAVDFEAAVEACVMYKLPEQLAKASTKLKLGGIRLQGDARNSIHFHYRDEIVYISQHTDTSDGDCWQFRVEDLREVINAAKKRYKIVEIEHVDEKEAATA